MGGLVRGSCFKWPPGAPGVLVRGGVLRSAQYSAISGVWVSCICMGGRWKARQLRIGAIGVGVIV
eukprot:scaffold6140_cov114-Isochrysis_galbana.AAC.5